MVELRRRWKRLWNKIFVAVKQLQSSKSRPIPPEALESESLSTSRRSDPQIPRPDLSTSQGPDAQFRLQLRSPESTSAANIAHVSNDARSGVLEVETAAPLSSTKLATRNSVELLTSNLHTPKWNEAVLAWKNECPAGFAQLERTVQFIGHSLWVGYEPISTESREKFSRLKRWQPALTSARGAIMAVAAIDPNKLAPVICGTTLFVIDVSTYICPSDH